jgi:hypothetical protein
MQYLPETKQAGAANTAALGIRRPVFLLLASRYAPFIPIGCPDSV